MTASAERPSAELPSSEAANEADTWRPAEAVAGLMAAGALFIGAIELIYRPFRLAPAALILVLIATVMSKRQHRLIGVAAAVVGVCFVIGAAVQVYLKHPLY